MSYNKNLKGQPLAVKQYILEIMTTTEIYLQKILPFLSGIDDGKVTTKKFNGLIGYEFPYPFCASLQVKGSKKRNRCAALFPHKESFAWTFYCCRKGSLQCSMQMGFPQFLKEFNPALFRRYHLERDQKGSTGKGQFLPRFDYSNLHI
jgi:hypothetical protein